MMLPPPCLITGMLFAACWVVFGLHQTSRFDSRANGSMFVSSDLRKVPSSAFKVISGKLNASPNLDCCKKWAEKNFLGFFFFVDLKIK